MSWFVVGGVAIGATAGAIAGSKKGGDDVWKGALLGGALGAAGGAGAGAVAGGAGAAGAGAGVAGAEGAGIAGLGAAETAVAGGAGVGAAAPAGIIGAEGAAAGGSGLALGGAGLETGGAMAGGAGIMGATPTTAASALPAANPMGLSSVPAALPGSGASFGSTGAAAVPQGGGLFNAPAQAMGTNAFGQAPIQMAQAPELATVEASSAGDIINGVQTGANKTGYTPPPQQSPLTKGFNSALDWMKENPMQAGILGIGALGLTGVLNRDNNDTFGNPSYETGGYPLSPDFKPSRVNPQQYRYKGSYADGGPVQTGMFPQSQMDRTQFATPSQMPVSREVVGADYDALINPYTGDMPRFAKGGDTRKNLAMIDPHATSAPQESPPRWVGASVANVNDPGIYIDKDDDTASQDALTAAQTRMGKSAARAGIKLEAMQKPTPMGKLNLDPVTEKEQMASGGITSLGSYAHGGNARLLRGPGDGMSDDIPATIADKQPARLADGEFVVPADVVSGLGNGSTEAGAKKLHQMMDSVRVERTGTKKQGKQIKAEKHIPGMAKGGIASYAEGGPADLSQYYVYDAGGNQVPLSTFQDTFTPAPPTQPVQPQVNPGQYAMGGQYTPDYRVPGSTLSGNLGRWSNIGGEAERAARQPSFNQQVTQSYFQNLGRAPDQMGFNQAMQSGLTAPQINQALGVTGEAVQANPAKQVDQNAYIRDLFQQYLGRNPEAAGQSYWSQQMAKSPTTGAFDVMQGIANSPEAQVRQAFQQSLGRAPEAAGQQYWQQQMAQGMTPEQMRAAVQATPEGQAYAAKQAEAKPAEKKRKGGILAAK